MDEKFKNSFINDLPESVEFMEDDLWNSYYRCETEVRRAVHLFLAIQTSGQSDFDLFDS